MIIKLPNESLVQIKRVSLLDYGHLLQYLEGLSEETHKKFAPHLFEYQSIVDLCKEPAEYLGYVAVNQINGDFVAYSVVKLGFLAHDSYRLNSYGLSVSNERDSTYAPSVADSWQGVGLGSAMLNFIVADLKTIGVERIILWGGVQSDNWQAVKFYKRNGFRLLGQFEYYGLNDDMILELSDN